MTRRRSSSKSSANTFRKLMVYAPIALELVSLVRRNQKAKRGKYTKLRKRDRALDFVLGQAERRLKGKRARRRWF